MKELPNCKIGVTNTVYHRLRELKNGKDTFNDVVARLLPEKAPEQKFDVVEHMFSELGTPLDPNCECALNGSTRCTYPCEFT